MNNVITTKKGFNIPFEKILYLEEQPDILMVYLINNTKIIIRRDESIIPLKQIVLEYNKYYGGRQLLHD
jgi:hypothetical protein